MSVAATFHKFTTISDHILVCDNNITQNFNNSIFQNWLLFNNFSNICEFIQVNWVSSNPNRHLSESTNPSRTLQVVKLCYKKLFIEERHSIWFFKGSMLLIMYCLMLDIHVNFRNFQFLTCSSCIISLE